ncbi:MAG: hypothetical protein HZB67_01340 [Candidatus Aenigmarchaeota archaeon]|nr:hypothetical protein [Candidatus Aenigmarchaeota archaeon]
MYYDLHVHTNLSVGENSLDETIDFCRKLGIEGVGIAKFFTTMDELKWDIPEKYELDIVKVLVIKANTIEELEKNVRKTRNQAEVIIVHGGDYEINRAACESSYVDILAHPELGRKDSGLDHICMKAAQENNVAIEINFREILESYKKNRVYVLSSMRENIRLCKKYGTGVITSSGAYSKWGLRSGRELASIASVLGLELGEAIASVSTIPEALVKNNREKLADRKWEGVTVVE